MLLGGQWYSQNCLENVKVIAAQKIKNKKFAFDF